jgi:serine/threonine-protein kinase HipA
MFTARMETRASKLTSMEAFLTLHQGLPREGPGHDDATREVLVRLPPLPANPVVFDLGCGPGRQTLVLARVLKTRIVAVDLHQPFLDQLASSAVAQGLSSLIETRHADMGALEVAPGSIDLVWSEGAAYNLGFAEAVRRWRVLLAPGGLMAVSECTWLTGDPADEPRVFWRTNYPAMGTVSENRRRAEGAGLEVLSEFVLPASAWWEDYYTPLLQRIAQLRPVATGELGRVLDETEREIDLYRKHGDSYGYVFYLLRAR